MLTTSNFESLGWAFGAQSQLSMNDELKTPVIAPRNQPFLMTAFPKKCIFSVTAETET